jgi:hypothetical protein
MSLNGSLQIQANINELFSFDIASASRNPKFNKLIQFLDGSGAGQANKLFVPTSAPAVAQSTNTDYDLSGTSLTGLGGTVSFTAVKAIIVIADEANVAALSLFGSGSTFQGPLSGTSAAYSLLPGMPAIFTRFDATGWAVTNSSADIFRITTPSTTGTYSWDLAIIGI